MESGKLLCAIIVMGLAYAYLLWFGKESQGTQHLEGTSVVQTEYDYVIIGGGTAGSVLASRLSEEDTVSVLILEAGAHYDNVPGLGDPTIAMSFQHSRVDWDHVSASNPAGLGQPSHYLTAGRVLGGSGAINYNMYVRGSPEHFDIWANDLGCKGWGYNDLLPYFKKAESIQIERLKHSEYHSVGGPVAVSELPVSCSYDMYFNASKELGYLESDYNGQSQVGFGPIQYSLRNGVRNSAVEYLSKDRLGNRTNLDISVDSFVTKVHIEDKVAKGVFYIKDGKKRYVKAGREVIVSAGALHSPKILMLSGIGPKRHLQQLNIPLVSDAPVGERLETHAGVILHVSAHKTRADNPGGNIWSKLNSALFGVQAGGYAPFVLQGFVRTENAVKQIPDLQILFTENIFDYSFALNYDPKVTEAMKRSFQNTTGFSVIIFLTLPKSRGSMKLETNDPFDSPVYDINQLTHPDDITTLLKGIRIFEDLISTDALKPLKPDISINKFSFCSKHKFQSDNFWKCFIEQTGFISYHFASTCRMGPSNDKSSVVDLTLKVKGVNNLRVCDASVFPSVTTGNTCAPTIAIAEKAAEIFKNLS